MEPIVTPLITYLLMSFTVLTSIIAFPPNVVSIESLRQPDWFDKFKFNAYQVWHSRQWYRMFTSGFLHVNWWHLIINMFVLYFFGRVVEWSFISIFGLFEGRLFYFLLYLLAIFVGNLPDLIRFKDKYFYNAVGASGAISAVLFTSILLFPWNKIYIFPIPIPIPAIIFGIIYLLYESYMDKRGIDNIGHSAHLWGAIFGFIFPIILEPKLFSLFLAQLF